jgi:hypothetical protein
MIRTRSWEEGGSVEEAVFAVLCAMA